MSVHSAPSFVRPPGVAASSLDVAASSPSVMRIFLIAGAVALALVATLLGAVLIHISEQQILREAEASSQVMAQSLAPYLNAEARPAPSPSAAPQGGLITPRVAALPGQFSAPMLERLRAHLVTAADLGSVLAVTLYDASGRAVLSTDTIYSSYNTDGTGTASASSQALLAALQGEISGTLSEQQTFVFFDRTVSSALSYSTFIPLYRQDSQTIILGACKVTLDVYPTFHRFDRIRLQIVIFLVLAVSALYAILIVVARHLDQQVRQHFQKNYVATSESREAEVHLRRVQDAMESTIFERTQLLRQSEARFREFAESASDWLWESDTEGRLTYISEGFTRIMGIDADAVLGRPRWEMTPPGEEVEKWEEHRAALAARRPFRGFSYTLLLPNGKRRFLSINGTPIFDSKAQFCGYRGTGSDITSQHEAEQTIVRLGRILEQSVNELYILDANSLRILQANRGARANLGYSMDELTLLTVLDIKPTETPLSMERRLAPLRRNSSQMCIFETLHQRKDGTRYPVEVRLQYMSQDSRRSLSPWCRTLRRADGPSRRCRKVRNAIVRSLK